MKNVRYNRGDEIVEITIRDQTGARIEVRRNNLNDEKENSKWLKWLITKWGVKFKVDNDFMDLNSEFFDI